MNSKHTKRALFSSFWALLLCFAMLLGTTFAWFTDTASTGVNKIQAGNLDMEVYHQIGKNDDGTAKWELIDGKTNLFDNVNGDPILWEPGATATETFKIVNAGNLAFKYAFYVNYTNATKTAAGKSLADVLTCGIQGYASDATGKLEDIGTFGNLLPNAESASFTVEIKWEPSANDNDYNVAGGLSIDLGVNVYATQYTYESDSTGNQYDADATLPESVAGQEEFNSAIEGAENGSVTIALPTGANVTLNNSIANDKNADITVIGDGTQTVDVVTNAVNAEGGMLSYQRNSSFTFKNVTIKAGEGNFDGIVCDELTFENCTITGKLTLYGKATFINCTFNNTMADQYSIWTWGSTDVEFEGCTFNTNGKAILLYGYGPTNLTVNNCTFIDGKNGTVGKAAIEVGDDYGATYSLTATNNTIYGFSTGKNTTTKVYGNKNSMDAEHLKVTESNNTEATGTYVADGVTKQDNTYYISNAKGLEWFRDQLNEHYNGFNGYTVKLTADIDLNNAEWYPIGQSENLNGNMQEFYGVFDGDRHTIKNLKIKSHTPTEIRASTNYTDEDSIGYGVGFFGWLSGAVKNVTFENVKVSGSHYVGVVAGYFQNTGSSDIIENCTVTNCAVVATHIDGTFCGDKAGGIVGMAGNSGTVKNCKVEKTTVTAGRDAGQVVGCAQSGSVIENCTTTNVTVTAGGDCTGNNIKNDIIGRDLR